MAFEIFCIELPNGRDMLEQLNQFIASHQVVTKQQQLVTRDGIPYMMFCLEYIAGKGGVLPSSSHLSEKTDVWSTLTVDEKDMYAKLKDLRNRIAEEEHVRPFVVFTNDQLGEMVKRRVTTAAAMKDIRDIGKSRMDKYARRLLPFLTELFAESQAEGVGETSETPPSDAGGTPAPPTDGNAS